MPRMTAAGCTLVAIDLQDRLMPAIHEVERVLDAAQRLIAAGRALAVPLLVTEQNPSGLGRTVPALRAAMGDTPVLTKMHFDACAGCNLPSRIATPAAVVLGCEAHVCVLQTVLGLLDAGIAVHVVADAVGSRHPGNHARGLARMAAHGADVVTAEMAIFEWLENSVRPEFRSVLDIVK